MTRRLRTPETGEYVEFSPSSGKAQVTSDVGERLVAAHDSIERVDASGDESSASSGAAEQDDDETADGTDDE